MLNIFDTFLPQLLLYPNPKDPLNGNAAQSFLNNKEAYDSKVKGRSSLGGVHNVHILAYFILYSNEK